LNTPESDPVDEMNTTPPNPPQSSGGGWSMPDPIFKKTSGYLPQGYEKKFSQEEIKTEVDDDTSTASMPRPVGLTDVEPQPEIAEIVADTPVVAAEPQPKKSGAAKVVFSLFGILVAIALVLIFIAVVYYLFMMPQPSSTF
jgi:hypothetical protein